MILDLNRKETPLQDGQQMRTEGTMSNVGPGVGSLVHSPIRQGD